MYVLALRLKNHYLRVDYLRYSSLKDLREDLRDFIKLSDYDSYDILSDKLKGNKPMYLLCWNNRKTGNEWSSYTTLEDMYSDYLELKKNKANLYFRFYESYEIIPDEFAPKEPL